MNVITESINKDSPWARLLAKNLLYCDGDRKRPERKLKILRKIN